MLIQYMYHTNNRIIEVCNVRGIHKHIVAGWDILTNDCGESLQYANKLYTLFVKCHSVDTKINTNKKRLTRGQNT